MIFLDPYLLVSSNEEMKIFNIEKECTHKVDTIPVYTGDISLSLTERFSHIWAVSLDP